VATFKMRVREGLHRGSPPLLKTKRSLRQIARSVSHRPL
jgi:hypothetical protein